MATKQPVSGDGQRVRYSMIGLAPNGYGIENSIDERCRGLVLVYRHVMMNHSGCGVPHVILTLHSNLAIPYFWRLFLADGRGAELTNVEPPMQQYRMLAQCSQRLSKRAVGLPLGKRKSGIQPANIQNAKAIRGRIRM